MAEPQIYFRCPTCGKHAQRKQFIRGALGHTLEILKKSFVPKGTGDNGGAIIWQRRPMDQGELALTGRAITTAAAIVAARVASDVSGTSPDHVLAELCDSDAKEVGLDWIEEAKFELERRQRIVAEDLQKRGIL